MASIVADFLPIEIKSKPYYIHAKNSYLSHLLLDATKAGQNVYKNEYNKINNIPYGETVDFKCLKCDYEEQNIDYGEIEDIWNGENFPKLVCPKCGRNQFVPLDIWKQKNKYKKY